MRSYYTCLAPAQPELGGPAYLFESQPPACNNAANTGACRVRAFYLPTCITIVVPLRARSYFAGLLPPPPLVRHATARVLARAGLACPGLFFNNFCLYSVPLFTLSSLFFLSLCRLFSLLLYVPRATPMALLTNTLDSSRRHTVMPILRPFCSHLVFRVSQRPCPWLRCWGRCHPKSRHVCERWATPRPRPGEALRGP